MGSSSSVAIIGGGPAGLFLARMVGLMSPQTIVDVYERNDPGAVYGFGVGLSERTMREISVHDPQTHRRIEESSVWVPAVELRPPGAALRYPGFGLSAIARDTMLAILREQAEETGANLHFRHEVSASELDAEVVAIAEGASSGSRSALPDAFGTTIQTGSARYIWLGTTADFSDAATMSFVRTPYGPIAAHSYPHAPGMSTVVIETDEVTWRKAGLGQEGAREVTGADGVGGPDEISAEVLDLLGEIFAGHLSGQPLVSNKSRWGTFRVVRNRRWSHGSTVLIGDAAHTAHFTVGSGTKMALEDGIALASALHSHDDRVEAFAAYERERRGPVTRIQRLAEPSMHWWETYGRRLHMPPAQFGMHFITRTVAVSYLGLRRRCVERVEDAEADFLRAAGVDADGPLRNAVAVPLRLGTVVLPNRLVTISPAEPGDAAPGMMASGLVLMRPLAGPTDAMAPPSARTVLGALLPPCWEPSGLESPAGHLSGPGTGPRFVELACPSGPETGPDADDLVRRATLLRHHGIAGVVLRGRFASNHWWNDTLRHASRLRTEASMAVAVCVPSDWALDLTSQANVDPWQARIQLALISGRADLFVMCPLSPDDLARAG